MTQCIKLLLVKSDNLSSIPKSYEVDGENQFLKVCLLTSLHARWDAHMCSCVLMHTGSHTHTCSQKVNAIFKDKFQPRISSDVQTTLQAPYYLCRRFDSQPFVSKFILSICSMEVCLVHIFPCTYTSSWHDAKLFR